MYNINKIQNYAARWVRHDYSHYTSVSSLQEQINWPPLSVFVDWYYSTKFFIRKLHSSSPLFTNTPRNYTRHLKHKRKQLHIQTTQQINRYIQIWIHPPNNHKLEFTATLSVCDTSGSVIQRRPKSSSLPQPVIHSLSTVNTFLHCTANVSFSSHGVTCDHNAIRRRSKLNHKVIPPLSSDNNNWGDSTYPKGFTYCHLKSIQNLETRPVCDGSCYSDIPRRNVTMVSMVFHC